MKVFGKLRRSRRRRQRQSSLGVDGSVTDDPASPTEALSSSSWGNESASSGPSKHVILLSRGSSDLANDDAITEASSLPPQPDDLNIDSPTNSITTGKAKNNNMAMVVYNSPTLPPQSLPESLQSWIQTADALMHSREMKALLGSSCDVVTAAVSTSRDVVCAAGDVVAHAALLPVTLPLHVATATTNFVFGVAGTIAHAVLDAGQPSGGERTSSQSPIDGLVHNVLNVLPLAVNTAGRITHDLGSVAVDMVSPVLGIDGKENDPTEVSAGNKISFPAGRCATSSGESSAERSNILDRLRLDFQVQDEEGSCSKKISYSQATASDISKFLLRVDDLSVFVLPCSETSGPSRSKKALYIDLGEEFSDKTITADALAQLLSHSLEVAASNKSAHLFLPSFPRKSAIDISWKPEGSTSRQIRKLAQSGGKDLYKVMSDQIFVWSGKYRGTKYTGSDNPFFLARGVVQRSPREFFEMLWDSDRTAEYNNFSLGRKDALVIDNSICTGGKTGVKLITSETKVPFTSLTVKLSALMHASALNEGSGDGFIIVSRSVNSGRAGCHVNNSDAIEKSGKNEILLGINIMRPVPGRPDLTDLMSVSQVFSSMVPQFLAFRIGMMGLEDFFNSVRKQSSLD